MPESRMGTVVSVCSPAAAENDFPLLKRTPLNQHVRRTRRLLGDIQRDQRLKDPRDVLITALICPQSTLSAADRGRDPPFPSLRSFLCPGVRQGLGSYVLTIEPAHVWLAKPVEVCRQNRRASLGQRDHGDAKAYGGASHSEISAAPTSRSDIHGGRSPIPTAHHPGPAPRRSFGIRAARRIWQVPITAPFCDIPVHVVKTPRIGRFGSDHLSIFFIVLLEVVFEPGRLQKV
jgi:hypothetical protein